MSSLMAAILAHRTTIAYVIPAIVLSAGRSTRMGRAKALLPLPGGDTFLVRIVRTLLEAGVDDVHPHRFRDTVAVRLLENGVPLERVAKILGHKSVRVTERSYGPWVRALQDTLEADVTRVWEARKDRPKLVRVK